MTVKNLTFVEKHIEKAVLGVCVLIASIVTWTFVFNDPYTVRITSTNEMVTAENIDAALLEAVNKLDVAINDPASPLPPMVVPDYAAQFEDRIKRGKAGYRNLDSPLGTPGLDVRLFRGRM